jgi:hypothetical protein
MRDSIFTEKVGKRNWRLTKAFSTPWATVPTGFVTNGASSPRFMWWLVSPATDFFEAAVVHDYLLSLRAKGQMISLRRINKAFFKTARLYQANLFTALSAYAAVSIYTAITKP